MFNSLWRALPRLLFLVAIGGALMLTSRPVGLAGASILAPVLFNLGLLFVVGAFGDAFLRLLMPNVDAQAAAGAAVDRQNPSSAGAGLVYLGHCLLRFGMLALAAISAHAAEPPPAALALLPVLKSEQLAYWAAMPQPSVLGGQVEQETCPRLTHPLCWSVHQQLRTKREQGIGLGQLTRTWNKDGSQRFDALTDLVRAHPRELAGFSWDNRDDPHLQLRALVLMDHALFDQVYGAASDQDHLAFMLAGYNGGAGAVRSDRVMCEATLGCNPARWFGNVERTSRKAKTAAKGYGQSFFEINRQYVRNVLLVRRQRYLVLDV